MGYSVHITVPRQEKCIVVLAPHTSNWDFFICLLYRGATGERTSFLMKKEWFFWPLGYVMCYLGGIPVYRNKHCNTTVRIAEEAKKTDKFRLCITPEGTRKANADWKKGFYYIALNAGIPILLYGLDYEKKMIVCQKTIMPNGDVDGQMTEIKEYYKGFKGRHPEQFAI